MLGAQGPSHLGTWEITGLTLLSVPLR